MTEQSQPFLDMAARIEKIDPVEFAGAVVNGTTPLNGLHGPPSTSREKPTSHSKSLSAQAQFFTNVERCSASPL